MCAKKPKKPEREEASGAELQLQRQASETWGFYQENYKPFEDVQIQRLEQLRSDSEMGEAQDVAVSQARENSRTPTAAAMAQRARPGTAGFTNSALALEANEGSLTSNALMLSEQQQQARADAGRSRLVDWGTGRNNEAAAITGRAASLAASQEANRVRNQNSADRFHTNETNDFLGTVAGAAAGAYGSGVGSEWGAARQPAHNFESQAIVNSQPTHSPWLVG